MRNKDLREWNPRRNDQHVLLITSSGISDSQIFFELFETTKSVQHDVVGSLVTSESTCSTHKMNPKLGKRTYSEAEVIDIM